MAGIFGHGTVFKISLDGSLTTLHSFSGDDGGYPFSNVAQDGSGNLFGTTLNGGSCGMGTIFEIAEPSGVFTNLHNFGASSNCELASPDGQTPESEIALDAQGNLYGVAYYFFVNPQLQRGWAAFEFATDGTLTPLNSLFGDTQKMASYSTGVTANRSGTLLFGTTINLLPVVYAVPLPIVEATPSP